MSNQLLNAVENSCARLATVLFLEDDGTSDTHAVAREVLKHLRAAIESENARPSSDAELSKLRVENERLRERCEAAEKFIAVCKRRNALGHLLCGNMVNIYQCGELGYRAELGVRSIGEPFLSPFFPTEFEAFKWCIAAGWLPDSNNKGGE